MYRVTRPNLHRALLKQFQSCGLDVEYGQKATEYYENLESKKGGVILENGKKLEADLIIASDGVNTKSWKLIGGNRAPARPSGQSLYRTAYPIEHALKDPEVGERFKLMPDESVIEMFMAPGLHGVVWRTETEFSWALSHPV
jgi:2-polyprenyl-6-methoxyphenol hydroxylase-like FAD-dependent oxidoreductase